MPRLDPIHGGLALAISAVLLWAAVSDIRSRRIPNIAVLALVGLYAVWVLVGAGAGLGSALGAAAISFGIGYGLFLFGVMGAGDVKLFAAGALFMGLAELPLFALATALAGGLVAVVSLLLRPQRAAVMFSLRGRGDYGRGVPYGVAIAMGGSAVLWAGLVERLPHLFSAR
jgi:prepilin peptidase CpaA